MPSWLSPILDAIFPPRTDARVAHELTQPEIAAHLRPRLVHEPWIMALFPYREPKIRALIRAVKFYGETAPLPHLADAISGFITETVSERMLSHGWDVPLLIPIPASRARMRERGYNQVERIAGALATTLPGTVAYAPRALDREERKSQVRVRREERADNIYGAFTVAEPEQVAHKQVILIDDVIESGSTMKDARRALTAAGVTDVLGIAIAH